MTIDDGISGLESAVGSGSVQIRFVKKDDRRNRDMKRRIVWLCVLLLLARLIARAEIINASEGGDTMQMMIGDTPVTVAWEDNASVDALKALAEGLLPAEEGLTIEMSMYGGFEQVGAIGQSLPRDDQQTTTTSGDIVLYSGNQLVVFYGSNSWAYTRLGHITDQTPEQMKALLGNGDVTITLSMQ